MSLDNTDDRRPTTDRGMPAPSKKDMEAYLMNKKTQQITAPNGAPNIVPLNPPVDPKPRVQPAPTLFGNSPEELQQQMDEAKNNQVRGPVATPTPDSATTLNENPGSGDTFVDTKTNDTDPNGTTPPASKAAEEKEVKPEELKTVGEVINNALSLKEENEKLRLENEEVRRDNDQLRQDISRLERELATANAAFKLADEEHKGTLNELKNMKTDRDNQAGLVKTLDGDLATTKVRADTAEKAQADLEKSTQRLENKIMSQEMLIENLKNGTELVVITEALKAEVIKNNPSLKDQEGALEMEIEALKELQRRKKENVIPANPGIDSNMNGSVQIDPKLKKQAAEEAYASLDPTLSVKKRKSELKFALFKHDAITFLKENGIGLVVIIVAVIALLSQLF
jgi:hypothetical protein